MEIPATKVGYGVFGRAYAVMFKNDLHHKQSVDHEILQKMILLDEETVSILYKKPNSISTSVKKHELFGFAQKFRGKR